MGLGMLFWNSVGLVTGWATARYGLFGLHSEVPSNKALNYAGVMLIFVSAVVYLFVKSDAKRKSEIEPAHEVESPSTSLADDTSHSQLVNNNNENKDIFDRLSPSKKRIVGIGLSVFAGICYGQSNTPILYVRDNYVEAGSNNLDFLFSYYTGILITSVFYFTIYCAAKKNKPDVYAQIVIPGLLSGE
jgi:hypothetical protein